MNQELAAELRKHPVSVYLNQQSKSSRETMAIAIRRALAVQVQGADVPVQDVNLEQVYSYPWPRLEIPELAALKNALEEKYSQRTAAQTITAVKGVLKASWDLGLIEDGQYLKVKEFENPKIPKDKSGRYIFPEEAEALKEACRQDGDIWGVRDLAILGWALTQGPRVSEIVGADLADYRPQDGTIWIRGGKGMKDRKQRLHNGAKAALDRWLEVRGNQPGALFLPIRWIGETVNYEGRLTGDAVSKMLRKRTNQADIPAATPHDLRRTAITNLIPKIGIVKTAAIVGHESIETTAGYNMARTEDALDASAALEF